MTSDVVLAYHGCDFETGIRVVGDGLSHLMPSKNPYDWLGEGIYFFEDDPLRAQLFAETAASAPHLRLTARPIRTPYVIGAVIRLGNCFDLSHQSGIDEIRRAYDVLERGMAPDQELPANRPARFDDTEGILHNLDRAVINFVHGQRIKHGETPYDTVRGLFLQVRQCSQAPRSGACRIFRSLCAMYRVSWVIFILNHPLPTRFKDSIV